MKWNVMPLIWAFVGEKEIIKIYVGLRVTYVSLPLSPSQGGVFPISKIVRLA